MDLFRLARLNEQKNPADGERGFEQRREAVAERQAQKNERAGRGNDEPGDKEINGLKGVETDALVVAEFLRGEKNDGRNNTEDRDVAEDRGGAIANAMEQILRLGCGARLGGAAIRAKRGGLIDTIPAMGAEGHGVLVNMMTQLGRRMFGRLTDLVYSVARQRHQLRRAGCIIVNIQFPILRPIGVRRESHVQRATRVRRENARASTAADAIRAGNGSAHVESTRTSIRDR